MRASDRAARRRASERRESNRSSASWSEEEKRTTIDERACKEIADVCFNVGVKRTHLFASSLACHILSYIVRPLRVYRCTVGMTRGLSLSMAWKAIGKQVERNTSTRQALWTQGNAILSVPRTFAVEKSAGIRSSYQFVTS